MPTTVNGIGTHYYGKSNRNARTASCRFCNRVANLETYETRLWFVILFIPVIPLGRKRIIDQCPHCTRHMVADADKFEVARQLQTSGSLDQFRRSPSPDTALEAHAQLIGFHDHEQAAEFRRTALERFPEHAGLRAGLAAQLSQTSAYQEGAQLYQAAYELDPNLPAARVGVAREMMGRGELDQARGLLDFLEVPGAGNQYSLAPLDQLAGYYQAKGRHEETLELAAHLLREIPAAGQQHQFRTFVQKSEKALRRTETMLPPLEHSVRGLFRKEGSPYAAWQRNLVIGGIATVLLVAGLAINNDYIRNHRKLHVLNAIGQPVQVQVDDRPPVTVNGMGTVPLSEGHHRVRVSGPVNETHEIDLASGYFDRWFQKPVWVLNPDGEAVLQVSTLYYAVNPQPGEQRLMIGQPFVALADIDYRFEEPPNSLSVKSNTQQLEKTAVQWVQGKDVEAFHQMVDLDKAGALSFAEKRLRRNPQQDGLLDAYLQEVALTDSPRVEAFLKSELDRRPVLIGWHRAFQAMAEVNQHDAELIPLYDKYLAADPKNGALLYLRGRIDPDWNKSEEFYKKSLEVDANLAWVWAALGVRAGAAADWKECLRLLSKAQELGLKDQAFHDELHEARLANGQTEEMLREYRSMLVGNAFAPKVMLHLWDALAVSGKGDEINGQISAWEARLPPQLIGQIDQPIRANGFYYAGKLEECAKIADSTPTLQASTIRAEALCALGRQKDLKDNPALEKLWENPWVDLSLCLAYELDGQAEEAVKWRERCCKQLNRLNAEARIAASLLAASEPPSLDAFHHLIVDSGHKALMLAELAERFPKERTAYQAEAKKFNISHGPSHYLVVRALDQARPPAP